MPLCTCTWCICMCPLEQHGIRVWPSCVFTGFADFTGFQSAAGPTSTSVNNQFDDFGSFQAVTQSSSQAPPLLQPTLNDASAGLGMGIPPPILPTQAQPAGTSGMGMGTRLQMQPGMATNPAPVSCWFEPTCSRTYTVHDLSCSV